MTATSLDIVHTGIAVYFGGSTFETAFRAYRDGPLAANGLATVRKFQPKRYDERDFFTGLAPGRAMGAYMVVQIPEDQETRQAKAGATGGEKLIRYDVILHVFHTSFEQHAEDAGVDVNNLIEAIKDRIRADRTLGGCVVDAGETLSGIRTLNPQPDIRDERVDTYFQMAFQANVYIIA